MIEWEEYKGVKKVISGGQDGVDIAGLRAGSGCGLLTGGTAPRFWKVYSGHHPELVDFGLVESNSANFKSRTLANVRDSDGTLVLGYRLNSPGTICTRNALIEQNKPYFEVQLPVRDEEIIQQIVNWLIINKIETLNVAGNRDKYTRYGDNFHDTYYVLVEVFSGLKEIYEKEE